MNFDKFYKSSSYFGSDKILKNYLNLETNKKLPVVIPHGVDYYQHEKYILDLNSLEPSYICLRDDIYNKIKLSKRLAIKFPHPWIFLIKKKKIKKGKGTLFVAPPCSLAQYKEFYNKIDFQKYKGPFSVLIKHRGMKKSHMNWWKKKGIKAFTAGNMMDKKFYYKLFDILNASNKIVLCNMSSAGIFAATIEKKIDVVENYELSDLETDDVKFPLPNSVNYRKVNQIWKTIVFSDRKKSKTLSLNLLGSKYFDSKKKLRNKIIETFKYAQKKPLYSNISNSYLYFLMIKLLNYNENIIKLFPNPFKKIKNKIISKIGLNTLNLNTINDFGYYKIKGDFVYPKTKKVFLYNITNPEPGHVPIKKK